MVKVCFGNTLQCFLLLLQPWSGQMLLWSTTILLRSARKSTGNFGSRDRLQTYLRHEMDYPCRLSAPATVAMAAIITRTSAPRTSNSMGPTFMVCLRRVHDHRTECTDSYYTMGSPHALHMPCDGRPSGIAPPNV